MSFASKKLTDTEQRWSVLEKEAYDTVWAIKKFRDFLLNRKFTVFSDHQPLQYLFEANSVSAKLHRWRLNVLEFDFQVKYLTGGQNIAADALEFLRWWTLKTPSRKCIYRK